MLTWLNIALRKSPLTCIVCFNWHTGHARNSSKKSSLLCSCHSIREIGSTQQKKSFRTMSEYSSLRVAFSVPSVCRHTWQVVDVKERPWRLVFLGCQQRSGSSDLSCAIRCVAISTGGLWASVACVIPVRTAAHLENLIAICGLSVPGFNHLLI